MSQAGKIASALKTAARNINGKLELTTASADDMLQHLTRGAYTAGRTVNGTQIFRYSQHIQRLSNSIIGLSPQGSYIPSLDTIRSVVTDKIQTTYDFLCDNDKSISENKHNVKFTVHFPVPINENNIEVNVHMSVLHAPRSPPIYVNLYNKPRSNASVKDTEWVVKRQVIYDQLDKDIEEILLYTNEGEVLEGSQSNCFVVQNGVIHTANDGILNGTVREMTLHLIEKEHIPLSFEPCNIKNLDQWEGAFITSTSRWIMNINAIKENGKIIKAFEPNPLIEKLVHAMTDQINLECEDVLH